ncbi:glycoside hydrolase family 26 protein [Nonomuraea lactucae]|uniref:glycoside hydrolase family 26 protein n=1 Tax=Nonomuraea lactucae TaxID=2249762 RepID=UPI000DE412CE|nr:glycosyl hydrolase [Nonomuraea lactucae]
MPQEIAGKHAVPRKRRRNLWALVAGASVLGVAGVVYVNSGPDKEAVADGAGVPERPCSAPATLKRGPACGAWWGIYTPAAQGSMLAPVTALERQVGRSFDVVFTYHDMSLSKNGMMLRDDEPELGRSRLLLLGWESEQWNSNDSIPWAAIARGEVDSTIIDPQARRIKEYGRPVLLGFDGEMELRPNSGTPAEYIAAYRHIVERFRQIGVTNVAWVWGVTGYYPFRNRWKAFYPGDAYVDWVSYDPYNFARCRNATWQSFEETVEPTYDWLISNGFGRKPFILSEYGTESDPDDPKARGRWYRDVPDVLEDLPNIKAVVQWNSVDADKCDFTLTGPGVLSGFIEAGKMPYVRKGLPKHAG